MTSEILKRFYMKCDGFVNKNPKIVHMDGFFSNERYLKKCDLCEMKTHRQAIIFSNGMGLLLCRDCIKVLIKELKE